MIGTKSEIRPPIANTLLVMTKVGKKHIVARMSHPLSQTLLPARMPLSF